MKLFHEEGDLSAHTVADYWNEISETTIDKLGAKKALKIDHVHIQNWISIVDWLTEKYGTESLENDIMILHYSSLYNELLWLQVFFLTGNYLSLHRSLRYNLEAISHAYHLHQQYRGQVANLNDKLESLITDIEEGDQQGQDLIKPVLYDVLDGSKSEIDEWFLGKDDGFGLWDKLCKSVHPSGYDIVQRISRNPNMIYWNQFNKDEAEEAIAATDAVFDVTNAVILETYPKIAKRARISNEFPGDQELYYTKKVTDQ